MAVSRSAAPPADVEGRPSHEFGRPSDFDRGWYSQAVVHSVPPPSLRPPPPPIGAAGSSLVYGGISGGLGAFLLVLVVQALLFFRHARLDFVRLLGRSAGVLGLGMIDSRIVGLAAATLAGALLGAVLGLVTRRLVRVGPRLVFFALFLPVLLLFVQAVAGKVAPWLAAELPFVPLLAGAVVYGACIAIVLPARAA